MCVVEGQRLWEMEGEEEEGMVTWHIDNIHNTQQKFLRQQ